MIQHIIERKLTLGEEFDRQALLRERTAAPDWSSIASQVGQAEEAGYDALVAMEGPSDAYLQLAIAAQQPSRLQLTTGISLAFVRSPVSTAYTAWDLQRMSGGRFVLGLGSLVRGHIVRRYSMPWSAPAKRMKEYVQVLKACWRNWQYGEALNFEGEFYQVTFMPDVARPTPALTCGNIPLHIAAVGPIMLRTAGEVCDGVRLHDFATRKYIDKIALPNLRQGFERSGRPAEEWDRFELAGGGVILTAADNAGVAALVENYRRQAAFYASTPAYRDIMAVEGWGDIADELHALSRQQKWEEMERLFTDEMVHRIVIAGRHDEIGPLVRERLCGVKRIRLQLPVADESARALTREIIQSIRA